MGKVTEGSNQKVAIVIGASGGIGKAVTLRLATEGVALVVHYHHSKEKAAKVVEQIRTSGGEAITIGADITQFAEAEALVTQTVQSFGRVDIMVICSGGRRVPDEMRILPRQEQYRIWNQLVELNLSGPAFCAYAVYPQMVQQNYGRIILISSTAKNGIQQGSGYEMIDRCSYAASKEGLVGLTHTLANYLACNNITVNCVAPGPISEPSVPVTPEKKKKALLIPMKRSGTPAEVAEVIAFLSSDKASYITGNVIYPSGGFMGMGFNPELVA